MAINYFQAYPNYFWQWEDNAEVIAIPNGNTIAYKNLILGIGSNLAPQGLPLFGSLVLALIALNNNAKNDISVVMHILSKEEFSYIDSNTLKDVSEFLHLLSSIPTPYKVDSRKSILLKAIFENCHKIIALKKSATIINDATNDNLKVFINNSFKISESENYYVLKTIALLNKKFNTVSDILQKMGDIPDLESLHMEEQVANAEPKDYIEELSENYKTFKIGTLVKTIWSGLNLPFHSTIPSQQPIGGVSDLTNKGNLDQLLISEFANDDLLFLSRLANNEALYVSRESPPTSNDMKRIILIDVSLKNWGTPKIIAFATMLAIAKHPKTDIVCEVFAMGKDFHPIEFDNIHGLIDALQIVETTLNSSKALADFFTAFPENKQHEIFVITEKSVIQQEQMLHTISTFKDFINYWIFSDFNGNVDIYKNLKNGRKHIQHLEVPIKRLWNQKRQLQQQPFTNTNSKDYYPILVKQSQSCFGFRVTENGEIFQLTKEKSLLRFVNKELINNLRGWELMQENLPIFNTFFSIGRLHNGDFMFLSFSPKKKEITLLNLRSKTEIKVPFTNWKNRAKLNFIFSGQHFYHYNNEDTWQIDMKGNITEKLRDSKTLFESHDNDCDLITSKYESTCGVFKNITSVGINALGNLVFNETHELLLNQGNHIKLNNNKYTAINIKSELNEDGVFMFHDGSTVEINRSGLIILNSSKQEIPTIYIPSVLQASLGVATNNFFAGNPYYYNEPLFEISVLDTGNHNLAVVKTIKDISQIDLRTCREIIDNTPRIIPFYFNEEKRNEIKTTFDNLGAKVEIKPKNPNFTKLETIKTDEFFTKYIKPFITTITWSSN